MNKIKVLLADDHKLFREGVRALLEKYQEIEVVGEADNGKQVIELTGNVKPDIILIDLTMPEIGGIEAIALIKKSNPEVNFIVLSMHEDGSYIVKSVQAGSKGYLLKNVDEEELIQAIKKVYSGEKYFNAKISEIMVDALSKEQESIHLTSRESEILDLVAQGLSTKMIADKLFLSTRTVETHRVNIMKKLQVNNTAELVKKAIDLGLLE